MRGAAGHPVESSLREQICELGRSIFERGLTHGSTGNISARCADGWLLTPTGSNLGRLDPARFNLRTLPERFAKMADPLAGVLGKGIDMAAAIAAVEERMRKKKGGK